MIFIAGASGFVGGHLTDFILSKGHKLKCLVRTEKAGNLLRQKGAVVVIGDITLADTLQGVLTSEDMVIHLVGIIEEKGAATFEDIHVNGTKNLVREAQRAGVRHFFYQSALGADNKSWSAYLKTKAEAESIVGQSGLPHTIFRPSLIIGPWDGFTKKIMEILKFSPVIPVPGQGSAKFQPLYIKDWLTCVERVIEKPAAYQGTYDIGGAEHISYQQIAEKISKALGQNKPTLNIPMGFMQLTSSILGRFLDSPPVTTDQLRLLKQDNICALDSVERSFGFKPMLLDKALASFIAGDSVP